MYDFKATLYTEHTRTIFIVLLRNRQLRLLLFLLFVFVHLMIWHDWFGIKKIMKPAKSFH